MKKLLVVSIGSIVLILCLAACGGNPPPPSNANSNDGEKKPLTETEMVAKGKKIYQKNCVLCHGAYGDMGSSGAYDLTVTKLSVEEKITVITNGRNTMTPFNSLLKEEQIKAVAMYTETLKK